MKNNKIYITIFKFLHYIIEKVDNSISTKITYVDIKKGKMPKLVSLLTNDFDMSMETIVAIYRRGWQIESLFKQI